MIYLYVIALVSIIAGVLYLALTIEKDTGDARERVDAVQKDKYSSLMGTLAAWRERRAATARAGTLTAVNEEAKQITETIIQRTANETARITEGHNSQRLQEMIEKASADHSLGMLLTDLAKNNNLDVPTYLEVQKKILLDEQERINQSNRAADAIKLGVIAEMLKDHQQMTQVQLLIDNHLLAIAELSRGFYNGKPIDPEASQKMIESRQKDIEAWEANKNGLRQRLLQAGNGEDTGGNDPYSDTGRNTGETVEADKEPLSSKKSRRGPRGSSTK